MSQAKLTSLLELRYQPIGIAFLDRVPNELPRIDSASPAGCAYWTLAAQGRLFYTLPEDHYGCPIGAFTHGLELPPSSQIELQSTVSTMLALNYLQPEEPSQLPRVSNTAKSIVYGPLDQMPVTADVAIVIGDAKCLMLLTEAARLCHLSGQIVTGRPGCGMIPHVMSTQQAVTNFGCIGNRVYTRIADHDFYYAFPANRHDDIVHALQTILKANDQLEHHHRGRLQASTVGI